MGKIFSIIIPVYNQELYVEKCIRSCGEQDILSENFEIIIVNDGSQDQSLGIISKVAFEFSNFYIIDKPNGGVSSARNAGLNIAQGKYIWFVDSDDWIEKNCLSRLISIMEDDNLDALQIGFNYVNNTSLAPCHNKFRITTPVLPPNKYVTPDLFIGGACGTIFKRELILKYKIRFDERMKLAEDQLFFLTLFKHSERIKRESILVYFYLNNPNSATKIANEADLFQSINKIIAYEHFNDFELYCRYLITIQFFEHLNLVNRNFRTLHNLIGPYILNTKEGLKYFEKKSRQILILYLWFGLPFLNLHSLLKTIKSFWKVCSDFKLSRTFRIKMGIDS